MSAVTARRARLEAEAGDLQRTIREAGFHIGAPMSWALIESHPNLKAWQSRLWYIGFAINHPELPELSP